MTDPDRHVADCDCHRCQDDRAADFVDLPCGVCGDTGQVEWDDEDGHHGPFECEDCSK